MYGAVRNRPVLDDPEAQVEAKKEAYPETRVDEQSGVEKSRRSLQVHHSK